MKKKRLLYLWSVFCLTLSFFALAREAVYGSLGGAQGGIRKTVKGTYYESVAGKNVSAKAVYNDNYFYPAKTGAREEGAYLQGELARLSMLASAVAYNREYAERFLKDCGYTAVEYVENAVTVDDNDHASFAVGVKKLGRDALVAVIVKGTGDNYEWVSNFNLGEGEVHSGFSLAEQEVYQELQRFLKVQKVSKNVRFWVAGHSRGAAVGNLLAKRLTDQYGRERVYAYTFATPRVALNGKSEGYENIFNFLNPGDFVTEVAPAAWGYARYGTDVVLASDGKKEMKRLFRKRLGTDAFGNKITYGGCTAAGKKAILAAFLDYGGSSAADYYQPRENGIKPANFFQKGIGWILAGDEVNGTVNVLFYSYGDPQAQTVLRKLVQDGSMSRFAHAHCLTGYLCWVEAMY